MNVLFSILIATSTVGLISLIGVILIFKKQIHPGLLKSLISLAAGSLLAVAILDLIPEALHESGDNHDLIFNIVLASILFFFLFERVLHWHHCHCEHAELECANKKQNIIYNNLIGDAIHNLIDGFLIAAAFMLDFRTGLLTTAAVILHEIPQEISDFGILLYAGLTKKSALAYNFFVALTAIGGAMFFYYLGSVAEAAVPFMAAFAAGNFIYLSTADLIPELHHEKNPKKIINHSIWLLAGVAIIILTGLVIPHGH